MFHGSNTKIKYEKIQFNECMAKKQEGLTYKLLKKGEYYMLCQEEKA
jgi:hypothetical protein